MKNTVDVLWVHRQFEAARLAKNVGNPVIDLLTTWEELDVDPKLVPEILDVFREVAQGHALLPNESEQTWVEAQRGNIVVGNTVRVRLDAYSGPAGQYHNGRVGKVVGIRNGDIIFRSNDDVPPFIDGAHYPPEKLERLVSE